jgi:Domain of unknown function (DUF1905)
MLFIGAGKDEDGGSCENRKHRASSVLLQASVWKRWSGRPGGEFDCGHGNEKTHMLKKTFTGKLQKSPKKGGWTYIV